MRISLCLFTRKTHMCHFMPLCKRVKFGVSGYFPENGLEFSMLMYFDHLQNWLVYGHGLLFFKFWHYFDLVKRVKFGVSGHFSRTHEGNGMKFWMLYPCHPQNWLDYAHGLVIFSCDQAALQMVFSVCPSVCPSVCLSVTPFWLCSHRRIIMNFQELLPMTKVRSMQKVKVRGQRSRSQRSQQNLTVSGL